MSTHSYTHTHTHTSTSTLHSYTFGAAHPRAYHHPYHHLYPRHPSKLRTISTLLPTILAWAVFTFYLVYYTVLMVGCVVVSVKISRAVERRERGKRKREEGGKDEVTRDI